MLVEKYAVLVHNTVYFVGTDKNIAKNKKNIFGENAVLRIYYGNPEDNSPSDYFSHKKQSKRSQKKDKKVENVSLEELANLIISSKKPKAS